MRRVSVDLDEFSTRDLIEELSDRGVITKAEHNILIARKERVDLGTNAMAANQKYLDLIEVQNALIQDAKWNMRRHKPKESLHCIAMAIPELAALEDLVS